MPWWSRLSQSGPFWMVVAGFCFGVMGVFVKLGSRDFSSAELVFYRCLAGALFILAVAVPARRGLKVDGPTLKVHLSRGISGFFALLLYFHAIAHLPLPTAVTLNYTSPLFLLLISAIWLRQWPHWLQALAVLLGFAGVALLLRPTFDAAHWPAGLIGLGSGLLASIAYLNVHELGRRGEPEWRTVYYFSLISALGAALVMLLQPQPLTSLATGNVWNVLGMSLAATCAQLAMTRAYRKGRSLAVASLAYLTVPFSTLFGVLIWADVLPPSAYLGMLLIGLCGVLASTARRSG
ncbi:DMT family transporter [Chitiniphilus purpureus]|uniref:DMT family transporter n=1 Tax=Chitiniphilus purpureus TaxID=2981137 RepID=A0ABY6DI31_9NEIS|nr:DMT family transporter [Chitiniphilus sp. CD1]UXY14009.1 DMT family transporter [Chitiniphilus sp. CD1]